MDHRTFNKRKELDRLICRKNQLTKIYEQKLVNSFYFFIYFIYL